MASSSYELCGYEELGVLGDGITPLESALGLPGASCLTLQVSPLLLPACPVGGGAQGLIY